MFISVSHSNSDWKSIRVSLRKICNVPRFFIMAPRQRWQHLHLSALTFRTHYIWMKVIEWIDPSALASGHALKRCSTRRLFVCVLQAEANLRLPPLIECATVTADHQSRPAGQMEEALSSVSTHITDAAGASTDDSPCDTEVSKFLPIERDPLPDWTWHSGSCFDEDDGRNFSMEIWSLK